MRVIRELLILEYESPSERLLGMWSLDYEFFGKVGVFMQKDIYLKRYLDKEISR